MIGHVSHLRVSIISPRNPKFSIFFPPDQKKSHRVRSKNTQVKDGSAPYLLQVSSMKGLGQGPYLHFTRHYKDRARVFMQDAAHHCRRADPSNLSITTRDVILKTSRKYLSTLQSHHSVSSKVFVLCIVPQLGSTFSDVSFRVPFILRIAILIKHFHYLSPAGHVSPSTQQACPFCKLGFGKFIHSASWVSAS